MFKKEKFRKKNINVVPKCSSQSNKKNDYTHVMFPSTYKNVTEV